MSAAPAREPREQERDHREARDRERRRDRAQPLQPEAEVGDDPREQEVERCAAAFLEHDLEELVERVAADEERRASRPRAAARPSAGGEEAGRRGRDRGDAEPEPVGRDPVARGRPLAGSDSCCLCRLPHGCRGLSLLALAAMPIYEYRCPDGHTFEVFQRMTDPPWELCEVCGKGPVEKVLYPVSVHFKGSGFYSTDYGRGGRKKAEAAGRRRGDSGPSEKKSDSGEKKARRRPTSCVPSSHCNRRRRSHPAAAAAVPSAR